MRGAAREVEGAAKSLNRVCFEMMATQPELQERVARVEQELNAVKQQLSQLMSSSPPEAALHLLATLWQVAEPPASPLSLQEARQRLAETLPPKWGSRLIQASRTAK